MYDTFTGMDRLDPAQTLQVLQSTDLTGADSARCAELLGAAERLRGWVDAFVADVTVQLDELHDTEDCLPAVDVHTHTGASEHRDTPTNRSVTHARPPARPSDRLALVGAHAP